MHDLPIQYALSARSATRTRRPPEAPNFGRFDYSVDLVTATPIEIPPVNFSGSPPEAPDCTGYDYSLGLVTASPDRMPRVAVVRPKLHIVHDLLCQYALYLPVLTECHLQRSSSQHSKGCKIWLFWILCLHLPWRSATCTGRSPEARNDARYLPTVFFFCCFFDLITHERIINHFSPMIIAPPQDTPSMRESIQKSFNAIMCLMQIK